MKIHNIARCIGLASLFGSAPLLAQDFPNKPITIVVPYPAGGTADLLPRLVAERLPEVLGVPVIVQNKPGAAGIVGAEYVARSAPDGYTLLGVPPHFYVSDLLYKLPFDPKKFVPISILATYPNILLASPKLPAKTLQQLLALAKTQDTQMNVASAGRGTSQHLSAEMLKDMGKIDFTHIPYKGTAPAISDLIAGHVDFMFDNFAAALPYIQSGRINLLGVGSLKRNPMFPDVPAINEVIPGFESVTWMGLTAPPGTPPAIADKLSRAVAQTLKDPKLRKQIEELQTDPYGSTADEMADTVRKDVVRWTNVIHAAKLTQE